MASDLNDIWAERSSFYGEVHRVMDDLIGVYHGSLPPEFDEFFHENQHTHIVNSIRVSWDDLANLAGKVFPLYVNPDNDTATAADRAEHQERIGYWYNVAGEKCGAIGMKMLMKVYMWWLIGVAEAVPMVLPDFDYKTPFFTFRDPRHHYPPIGWTPYTQAAPENTLFAYEIPIGELKGRYPDLAGEIDRKLARTTTSSVGRSSTGDVSTVYIGEYYSADSWIVQTLGGDEFVTLARSDQGDPGHPNVMPVAPMALYSPGSPKGRSIFADQVSIQAMMARLFSQKLDYADATLYPLIFTTPLSDNTVRTGAWAINEWDPTIGGVQPRVEVIAPKNSIDFDQTMSFVLGLSRMLNRSPESFQGQGDANSSKALDKLQSGVSTTIKEMFWPPALSSLAKLYEKAAIMDVNLWGAESKKVTGQRKNARFTINYRPNTDLRGRESKFEVKPGAALAGYQGTLEIMQLNQSKLMSRVTALEEGEWTEESEKELRRIQSDNLEDLEWADLQAKAAQGMLKPDAIPKLLKATQTGTDLFEAIADLMTNDELLLAPPTPPAAPAGAGGAGGLPPELAALAPSLGAIHGTPGGVPPGGPPPGTPPWSNPPRPPAAVLRGVK